MVYLQGGPSHLDLWDPKDNVPDNVRSVFKTDRHQGARASQFTEILPKLAQVTDKFTIIRSMSYTPNGLFNHTAAIYQMMTGYTTDKVSPSGQLEPPSPKDFPNFGSQHHPAQAADRADAAVRDAAAAAAGDRTSSARAAPPGSSARRTTRTRSSPTATTWTWPRWTGSRSTTSSSGPRSSPSGSSAGPSSATRSTPACPTIDKAVADYNLNEYYDRALSLVISGRAREAFDLDAESRQDPRPLRPQHLRPELPAGPPAGRGRHAGRRGHLAQGRQLRQPLVGPPRRPDQADEEPVRPDARRRPLRPDHRPGRARHARRTRWSSPSASSAAARRRASAPPATATAPTAATTGRTATPPSSPAPASSAATSTASPTRPAPPRVEDPVHPGELLATIYHAFGIDPATIVYNHLNQPRELVKAEAVTRLFA